MMDTAKCPKCDWVLSSVTHYEGGATNIKDQLVWCANPTCEWYGLRLDVTTLRPKD
jgi:hypothetical protein